MKTIERITELLQKQRFTEVRSACVELLYSERRNSRAWTLLAQAFIGLQQGNMAKQCIDRAFLLDPYVTWVEQAIRDAERVTSGKDDPTVINLLEAPHKTVSAMVLTRNNERTIEQCILALLPAVDEIVVVDTGSTDNTIRLVKSFGLKVNRFEWDDDFSAARNYALSLVSSDWVIAVDSDEILHHDDVKSIRLAASLFDDLDGPFALQIIQVNKIRGILDIGKENRMFPVNRGIKWTNPIHEQLTQDGNEIPLFQVRIRVLHDGYDPDVIDKELKLSRNVKLLERFAEQSPDNPLAHSFLSREYLQQGNIDGSIKHGFIAKDLYEAKGIVNHPALSVVLNRLISALDQKGQVGQAEKLAVELVNRYPDYPDGWYAYGNIMMKRVSSFMQLAESAMTRARQTAQVFRGSQYSDTSLATWKTNVSLADMQRFKGNWIEAIRLYNDVLREVPDFPELKNMKSYMISQATQIANPTRR